MSSDNLRVGVAFHTPGCVVRDTCGAERVHKTHAPKLRPVSARSRHGGVASWRCVLALQAASQRCCGVASCRCGLAPQRCCGVASRRCGAIASGYGELGRREVYFSMIFAPKQRVPPSFEATYLPSSASWLAPALVEEVKGGGRLLCVLDAEGENGRRDGNSASPGRCRRQHNSASGLRNPGAESFRAAPFSFRFCEAS